MRKLRTTLLAGAGALLVAGAAVAAEKYDHVMKVALPDGSVAQIQYDGKVAPRVVIADAPVQQIALDPFADMDAMFAAMEMQHRQMMQQVARMQAQMEDAMKQAQSQTRNVAVSDGAAPANGVVQYSFVSTTSSDGCTTSVQWRSNGQNAQPQVYKTSSGNCAAKPEDAQPTKASAPKAETSRPVPGANRT
jgi:hypothetical protein